MTLASFPRGTNKCCLPIVGNSAQFPLFCNVPEKIQGVISIPISLLSLVWLDSNSCSHVDHESDIHARWF